MVLFNLYLFAYLIIFAPNVVFALWMNSLDVTPAVNNIYEDLKV